MEIISYENFISPLIKILNLRWNLQLKTFTFGKIHACSDLIFTTLSKIPAENFCENNIF